MSAQQWFKKFWKGDESIEDEEYNGWPSEVDKNQIQSNLEANPLKLHEKLLKNQRRPFHSHQHLKQTGKVKNLDKGVPHVMSQRRQWHPTPVLLPGKSHGQRSLVGCSPCVGSLRVGHDWATSLSLFTSASLSLFTFMHWRGKWQPTPVFLPGESQRQRSLVGCRLWGRTESGTIEAT